MEISDINGKDAQVSTFGTNPCIGNTGVNLRYHNLPNYEKLLKPHQDELCEWWKKTNEGNGRKVKAKKPNTKLNNHTKKAIISDVNEQFTERMKALDQNKDDGK